MTLYVCQIPEDHAEITTWLNRQLVGVHLRELVAELSACPTDDTNGADLSSTLGSLLEDVLEQGLAVLERSKVRQLLASPHLLLDLQERILFEGGPFWQELDPSDHQLDERAMEGRDRITQFVEGRRRIEQLPPPIAPPAVTPATRVATSTSWYAHPAVVSLVTAATVLVALFLWDQHVREQPQQVAAGWGWSQPGALNQEVSPQEYLRGLADAADQWFNKRPTQKLLLAKRISAFRHGCSTLIFAEHRPLDREDRQWLVTKCQAWSEKLDQHLADLEAGKDLELVRSETDDTVTKLATALRARAAEV